LARFNELASEKVSVDDRNAALGQKRGSGGFSHAHAASKT
jgi:hypothetical protein